MSPGFHNGYSEERLDNSLFCLRKEYFKYYNCYLCRLNSILVLKQNKTKGFTYFFTWTHLLVQSTVIEKNQNSQKKQIQAVETLSGEYGLLTQTFIENTCLRFLRYSLTTPSWFFASVSSWSSFSLYYHFPSESSGIFYFCFLEMNIMSLIVVWKDVMRSGVKCTYHHGRQEKRWKWTRKHGQQVLLNSGV